MALKGALLCQGSGPVPDVYPAEALGSALERRARRTCVEAQVLGPTACELLDDCSCAMSSSKRPRFVLTAEKPRDLV